VDSSAGAFAPVSFFLSRAHRIICSGITIGDVNGDGQVDVVAATNSGQVWVINGATGDSIANFPLKAGGPILAPVTLAKLHDNGHPSMQLVFFARRQLLTTLQVFMSHDGNLYIVDGWNGCTSK
jgi:hypothetical protein